MKEHFQPKLSVIAWRHTFEQRDQRPGESAKEYIAALRKAAKHCEFKDLEEQLRDRFVCGLRHRELQQRLFAKEDLSFQDALREVTAEEAAGGAIKNMRPIRSTPDAASVHQEGVQRNSEEDPDDEVDRLYPTKEGKQKGSSSALPKCLGCGGRHKRTDCKFRSAICRACGKQGHIAAVCLGRQKVQPQEELRLKGKIDIELDKLIQQGVLEPVDSSPWETPIVTPVKANGDIRICADYKCTLNKALQQHAYPVPVVSHILASLKGGRVFAKLDLAQAYQQLPVDDDAAVAQTIVTHRGAFKANMIRHATSAPFHPSTNGMADRMVRITKDALKKITYGDWHHRVTGPLSYEVSLDNGRVLRRHIDQLRPRWDLPTETPGSSPGGEGDPFWQREGYGQLPIINEEATDSLSQDSASAPNRIQGAQLDIRHQRLLQPGSHPGGIITTHPHHSVLQSGRIPGSIPINHSPQESWHTLLRIGPTLLLSLEGDKHTGRWSRNQIPTTTPLTSLRGQLSFGTVLKTPQARGQNGNQGTDNLLTGLGRTLEVLQNRPTVTVT
ncbi:hypothetical protein NXF25_001142 [Crotalus adamanteus]|uniref:CCHC-type domain-containing protein n=1 Tax=Crotalus adamanteus TaxID=8729 RepID=A0AAW1C7K0_CROAD